MAQPPPNRQHPWQPREPQASGPPPPGIVGFTYRVLIAVSVVAGAVLVWRTADMFLLAFGGVLVALLLRSLSVPLARHTPLPHRWALAVVVAVAVALLGVGGWFLGDQLAQQLADMGERLPDALAQARDWLHQSRLGGLVRLFEPSGGAKEGAALTELARFATTTFGAVGNLLLILFLGVYFAADPGLYRRGLVRLMPHAARPRVGQALGEAGSALRRWLLGKIASMLLVGGLTWAGLWLLGMPLALSLGVLAGLLEFVPFFGPLVAAVPGVLFAFTVGPATALHVTVLYVVVQQVESYLITPLIQRWAVSLPPALSILCVVGFGLVFGPLGVIFAVPLMVLAMVLVERLYREPALHDDTKPLG